MKPIALALVAAFTAAVLIEAQAEKLDYATISRIRDEGLNRSQVMDHISWLSDVYGWPASSRRASR
jgi:carboxypeptidase Q